MTDDIQIIREALALLRVSPEWPAAQAAFSDMCSPDRLERLLARLEAAERDAVRWRWLNSDDSEWEPLDAGWLCRNDLYGQHPADLNAFVDAALKAAP